MNISTTRFTLPSSFLFHEIVPFSGLTAGRVMVPILSNFLFEVSSKELIITASDLHTTVETRLPIKGEGACKIAVPANLLVETLKNLPDQPVEFAINMENYSLTLRTKNGNYRIACENGVDFPEIAKASKQEAFSVDAQAFKKAIKQSLFAAAKDEMHPYICGVNISIEPGTLTFAATDGHRLVRCHIEDDLAKGCPTITLPSKAAQFFVQLLPEAMDRLDLFVSEKRVHFFWRQLHMSSSIIGEPFPQYYNAIPEGYRYQLTINRQALLNAMKLIDFYANKATHEVCLSLKTDSIEIEAEDMEFSNRGKTELPCDYQGEEMKVRVNAKLFFEMVKNMDSQEITLHLNNPQKAIIMKAAKKEEKRDLLMLIMPIAAHRDAL